MHRVGSRSIRTVRQQQHDHRESGRVRIVGMHTLSDRQEVQAQGVGSEALLPRLIKPLSSRSLAIRPPGSILIEWSHPTDRNGGALFFPPPSFVDDLHSFAAFTHKPLMVWFCLSYSKR